MGFVKDFVWGAATASYQIEGAWNKDGKGSSIWDEFTHTDGKISDKSTGDIACDHYNRFKEDVKLMADMGLKAYRFSIAWSRIIPNGTGEINQNGIKFYSDLIDELLKYNIEPYVTLYHWDLPYKIHLNGGWLNNDISDWFERYTDVVAKSFGDRVKNFITFNEPQVFTGCGYMLGSHAPGYTLNKKDLLHIGCNIHKAHGKAVRALRNNIPDVKIGFTLSTTPLVPETDNDTEAARKSYFDCNSENFVFSESFWIDPIVMGKYPEKLLKECEDIFPTITEDEMKLISLPIDFIGLNIYRGKKVRSNGSGCVTDVPLAAGYPRTAIGWDIVPKSTYWGTKYYYERYNLPIFITENGMSAHDCISIDGKVHDPNRIDYLHRYLLELKKSADDGTDIRGYFQWSLMDNFEWACGYNERFGLIYVDYTTQKRTVKDSAEWYKKVIKSNGDNL